jgi:plasmid maintenance system antidote protein VapI
MAADDLRALMAERGLTYDAVALLAGVHKSTVSRVIAGQQRATAASIVKLSRALHISASRMRALCDAALPVDQELEDAR